MDNIKLGKRAVSCDGWKWMEGMLPYDEHDGPWARIGDKDEAEFYNQKIDNELPLLTDPATIGCLRERVRELYDARAVWVELKASCAPAFPDYYVVVGAFHPEYCTQPYIVYKTLGLVSALTEAEALVSALEMAPALPLPGREF